LVGPRFARLDGPNASPSVAPLASFLRFEIRELDCLALEIRELDRFDSPVPRAEW